MTKLGGFINPLTLYKIHVCTHIQIGVSLKIIWTPRKSGSYDMIYSS